MTAWRFDRLFDQFMLLGSTIITTFRNVTVRPGAWNIAACRRPGRETGPRPKYSVEPGPRCVDTSGLRGEVLIYSITGTRVYILDAEARGPAALARLTCGALVALACYLATLLIDNTLNCVTQFGVWAFGLAGLATAHTTRTVVAVDSSVVIRAKTRRFDHVLE
jgi:hypothetical protein